MMLKKFLCVLSLSTALCVSMQAHAATLSDTITVALTTHPQIKAGTAAREQADRTVWEQKSDFFPSISLDAQDGRMRLNDKTTRANTGGSNDAYSWMGQGTVTVRQTLFDDFSTLNRYRSAKDRYQAAEFDLSGTAEDVALRAAKAHLNLMRTRELLSLAGKFVSDVETRRKSIVLMLKGGASDESELLQAEEILIAAKNARLGFEEAFRAAESDYIEVTGNAVPAEPLVLGEESWNAQIPKTVDTAIISGLRANPYIQAAGKMTASLTKDVEAERASLAPHISAEMSYMKQDQSDVVGGETDSAQALVRLGWNFSTGGGQVARIQRTEQQKVESIAKRQGVMRNVERDIRQKYAAMQTSDQQFALLIEREASSQKVFKNFQAQFEGGLQTNLQLIAANSKLFDAQTALTDARFRRILLRLELLSTMGNLRSAYGAAKTGISQKG